MSRSKAQRNPVSESIVAAAAAAVLLAAGVSGAGTAMWVGGGADANWQTAGNFVGGSGANGAPAAGDSLQFAGTAGLTNNNDTAAGTSFPSITFNSGAGAFVLGGNSITTGSGVFLTNNSSSLQTINLPIVLGASGQINAAAGDVQINGGISGAFDLIKIGGGTLTLTGANSETGRTGVGNFPNGVGMTPSTHEGGGTLVLDFSAANSPTSNVIYNGVTPGELRLGSGSIVLKGKDGANNTQAVGNFGVATGFTDVALVPGAGGTMTLNGGNFVVASGAGQDNNKSAIVNFDIPAGATVTTTATNSTKTGLLMTNADLANITVNRTDWATASGGSVAAYSAYTPSTATGLSGNADVVVDLTATSTQGPQTIRFNNTGTSGTRTVTLQAPGISTINGGGILVTPAMGGDDAVITGSGIRGNSNRGLFIADYNTGGGRLIINSPIANNGSGVNCVTIGGGGTVVLGGNNTYADGTYVMSGTTLVVTSDANLGLASGSISVTSASSGGATVTLSSSTYPSGFVVGASLLGSTIKTLSGTTVTLNGNANADIAAATPVSWAADSALSLDGGTLRADATFAMQGTRPQDTTSNVGGDAVSNRNIGLSANGGTIEVTSGNTLTVNGVVSSQSTSSFGKLTKNGAGTLVLNGADTYAGGTVINGGTIQAGNNAALGSSTATLTFATGSNGKLQVNGKTVTMGGLVADGTAVIENANAANGTLVVGSGNNITFAGLLQDGGTAGRLTLTKQGSGSLTLTNANTLSGDTLVGNGSLVLANGLALQNSSINQQSSGTVTFDASVTSHAFAIGGIKNNQTTHTIALQDNAATPNAVSLSIGQNGLSGFYTGSFTGPGSLTKVGTGTLTLSGSNSFSGLTTVAAGTLSLQQNAWGQVLTGGGAKVNVGGTMVFDYTGTTTPETQVAAAVTAGKIGSGTADHGVLVSDDLTSAVTLTPALYGDLNGDGIISADDYALMDRSAAKGVAGSWAAGDFNYDGVVNSADYLLMDTAYGHATGQLSKALLSEREAQFGRAYVAALTAAVPEPASVGLLGLAAVGLLGRRSRRRV